MGAWVLSESATETERDQEFDLGDGWWASVAPEGDDGTWSWSLWDQWLTMTEEGFNDPVETGVGPTEAEAKAAALLAYIRRGNNPCKTIETPMPPKRCGALHPSGYVCHLDAGHLYAHVTQVVWVDAVPPAAD